MPQTRNINVQEENDIRRIANLIRKNMLFFILGLIISLATAFFINRYSTPIYSITSSILIKGRNSQPGTGQGDENDFLYSNLFGGNQNFQNELWIMKSYPVVERTSSNLDLSVTYYSKGKLNFYEIYKETPFKVSYLPDHPQPLDIIYSITFVTRDSFNLTARKKHAYFVNFETNQTSHYKEKWSYKGHGKLGELIETPDMALIVEARDTINNVTDTLTTYGFKFRTIPLISEEYEKKLNYTVVDRQATVIKINLEVESPAKGVDFLNELMYVYSDQNLERKNHTAAITIEYIESQLNQISDSLSIAEDNLQRFRASNQLLDISNQATGIVSQHIDLQNQLAELVSRKRYFDYVSELLKNDNFSNLMLPASIGISDQLLNRLITELLTAQSQRANLIENNQERNPLVQKLNIQIENLKKTITENINAVGNTTSISIDEMTKRIRRIESEINRLPATQRQLGTIERKFRLNDAIYNYLMQKHAEAKITKASNLPDDLVIEPAKLKGKVSPNKNLNYMISFFLGFFIPFGFVYIKDTLKNTIESQDDLGRLTNKPVLGKILHNRYRTRNLMYEFPKSEVAESFRALRTNLDFYIRGGQKKLILITSCFENEGKSFIALNLAMSYAQLGRKTILVDFDLRKPKIYFREGEEYHEGLSSYMIDDDSTVEKIINKSPHEKLDYILSGILPPNPVELIALDKTEKLLTQLKENYDIVVLDTTPLAQVTDAYLLIAHAELNVLVARYGQTSKNVLGVVLKDLDQKNIKNICLVLNDNRAFRDQYGFGYGYYNKKKLFSGKRIGQNGHKVNKVT
jgi:capsular exopolysaccharide synthesis family protein